MKKISVSVFGEKCEEKVFGTNGREREFALSFIEAAIVRGDSVSVDVVECMGMTVPEYLKNYASL